MYPYGGKVETYLTIEELAAHLKLAVQTIRRYVLNREIPYHKIKKVVRFRLSEIERWIDCGGVEPSGPVDNAITGGLFEDMERVGGEAIEEGETVAAGNEGDKEAETGGAGT